MDETSNQNMRREFANREDLIAYLSEQFPTATECDRHISPILGGQQAAEAVLNQVNPVNYAKTRSFLQGAVTRLSPYQRIGFKTPL